MRNLRFISFFACLSMSCAVHLVSPPPPPPPLPPAPHMMSYEEAVQLGSNYAGSRGYQYQIRQAHLAGNRVWKLRFDVLRADARGRLKLDYDAFSRQLLNVDEHLRPNHRGDNDDDEEDDHGRGHRKWKDDRDD